MAFYALGDLRPHYPQSGAYWVAENATIIGNVRLQENANVWFGCVLRGDNELIDIGENSNVQDLTVIHTDPGFAVTIGKGCTIGHRAILHGCTIGDNSLIGMGATLLNGAKIGKNCIIGANALITEGTEIPDYSLVVGAPGKVIRQLDVSISEKLTASATHYVTNSQRFARALTRI